MLIFGDEIERNKTMEKIYCIHLHDYSTPSFVSSDKMYFGTKDEILKIIEMMEKEREETEWGPHPMCKQVRDYFNGTGDGIGSVFGEEDRPIIYEVDILCNFSKSEVGFINEHLNTWDCVYKMEADKVDTKVIYIKLKYFTRFEYCRAIKSEFTGLHYNSDISGKIYKHKITGKGNWGHPGIIVDSGENKVTNSLYILESTFDNIDELNKDIRNHSTIEYRGFFEDVLGDG